MKYKLGKEGKIKEVKCYFLVELNFLFFKWFREKY